MKSLERGFWFGLAAALGVCTSILYSNAGVGAAGVLILGALLSTAIFSFIGGRLRVWLAAISVLPPFVVSSLDSIRGINRESFWEALCDTSLPSVLPLGCWWLYLWPLCLQFSTSRIAVAPHRRHDSISIIRTNPCEQQNGCRQRLGWHLSSHWRLPLAVA